MPAAIYATKEIGLPVLATTLSLLAVFLPVAFMQSIPGRFLRSFGLTMGAAIADLAAGQLHADADAVVALLRSRPTGNGARRSWNDSPTRSTADRARLHGDARASRSPPLGRGAGGARGRSVSMRAADQAVPKGFLPKNDEAQFQIDVRTPEGPAWPRRRSPPSASPREVRQWPEVRTTVLSIGDNQQKTPNLASIFVRLRAARPRTPRRTSCRHRARSEIVSKLPKDYRDQRLDRVARSARVVHTRDRAVHPERSRLRSSTSTPTRSSQAEGDPGAVDVDTTLVTGNPELVATVNRRKAADLGVNVLDVALASQLLIGGVKVSRFEEAGRDTTSWCAPTSARAPAPRR
jgi:multidrug efflux pump subunit AcrB